MEDGLDSGASPSPRPCEVFAIISARFVVSISGGWDRRADDPEKVGRLLRSLARNVATPAAAKTLAGDVGGG